MTTLAAVLTYTALAVIALSMPRHYRAVRRAELPTQSGRWLRLVGWALLVLSGVATGHAHGVELGAVVWLAQTAVAGFALTLLIAYRPRWWAAPVLLLALAPWL